MFNYEALDPYWKAFLVGLSNTLRAAVVGIVLTTILGTLLGIGRLSRNFLVRSLCTGYVELFRNIPVLLQLLMAEIRRLPRSALDLPLPDSADLMQLCERILADLSTRRASARDAGEMNTSTRTLYRRFLRETGITFARWKQQARLLEAIRRLAEGKPVTAVAMDLGYESPGAFSTMFRRALGVTPRTFSSESVTAR